MTASQYLLNLALLVWILSSNLGTRTLTRRRMTLPLLIVAGISGFFLTGLPSRGNDGVLELVGLLVGVAFGVVAALTVRVSRDGGRIVTTAGAGFAVIWLVVIAGRLLFAYGAEHWFTRGIGEFSRSHLITGADAWTAAFVIMALAMVVSRLAVTGLRASLLTREEAQPTAPVSLYR